MARYIAKNVVAAGSPSALVQLALRDRRRTRSRGGPHRTPAAFLKEDPELVRQHFKLTPRGIMEELDLHGRSTEDGGIRPPSAAPNQVRQGARTRPRR
jgi:S-adenosylmethionine synthetase